MRYTVTRTTSPLKLRLSGDSMTIKELRTACGMTQQAFADYLHIPKRSIENWENGTYKPADYLLKLIEYKLRTEGLI